METALIVLAVLAGVKYFAPASSRSAASTPPPSQQQQQRQQTTRQPDAWTFTDIMGGAREAAGLVTDLIKAGRTNQGSGTDSGTSDTGGQDYDGTSDDQYLWA